MENNNNSSKKSFNFVVALLVIVLIVAVCADLVANYAPLKDIFSKTVNYTTSKEVTVTDKGIADAVEKVFDATVVVKVGNNSGQINGWGSGFVYKTDDKYGYIITNHHVVDDAKKLTIMFTDESSCDGELIGSDEYADIAVVKVPKDKVKAVVELGKTDELRPGDTVFAVGTPVDLSYSFTVTRGILSGKNRLVGMSSGNKYYANADSWYMNLLQIDATINSGNSGGPLANSNGQVVGINNSKLSNNGSGASIENMGFAIPIEVALNVAEQLINTGTVTRPLLGVSMTTIEGAAQNGIELDESIKYGAVVNDVESGSSADKAGLKKGDVIVKFDEFKVDNFMYLKYYLYRHKVGDSIKLTYIRNGKENSVVIKLSN